jgi:hypothetical protein
MKCSSLARYKVKIWLISNNSKKKQNSLQYLWSEIAFINSTYSLKFWKPWTIIAANPRYHLPMLQATLASFMNWFFDEIADE